MMVMSGIAGMCEYGSFGKLVFLQSFYTSIYPWCLVTFCYYLSRHVRVHC